MSHRPLEGIAPAGSSSEGAAATGMRLQKLLAAGGWGSRRACEALIAEGRVTVDGARVAEQGRRVHPGEADVRVDGVPVLVPRGSVYLALNKPRGVVSTMDDPHGRPCLADFVAGRAGRLFHVGRLDADTEGLILLTNDGEFAQRLSHPSHGVPKTYLAEVVGPIPGDLRKKLRQGITLEDGAARADQVRIIERGPRRGLIEVVVHEGRTHLVRRLLGAAGTPVRRLARTAVGPVQLGGLRPGRTRPLTRGEVAALLRSEGGQDAETARRLTR